MRGRRCPPARQRSPRKHSAASAARRSTYRPTPTRSASLCDTPALFAFFARSDYNVGGITDVYLTRNVWLRPSHVERDRLVGPSGAEASGDRTLTYFVAHEITHVMTARRLGLGLVVHHQLDKWQQEGIRRLRRQRGHVRFRRDAARLPGRRPRLDPRQSGLYLRYHLLVSELIDRKGMTAEELMSHPIDAAPVERELAGHGFPSDLP